MKLSRHLLVSLVALAALSGCGTDSGPTQPGGTLDTTPPPAPTNVEFTITGATRTLTWDASAASDLAGYEVWQAANGTGSFALAGMIDGDDPNFALPQVDSAVTMDYRVRAYDITGNRSAYSGTVSTELVPVVGGDPSNPGTGRIAP